MFVVSAPADNPLRIDPQFRPEFIDSDDPVSRAGQPDVCSAARRFQDTTSMCSLTTAPPKDCLGRRSVGVTILDAHNQAAERPSGHPFAVV